MRLPLEMSNVPYFHPLLALVLKCALPRFEVPPFRCSSIDERHAIFFVLVGLTWALKVHSCLCSTFVCRGS